MFRIRMSLAVLGTVFAIGAGAADAEARHCRHQHRHHRSNCCQQSYGTHHGYSGYQNQGNTHTGMGQCCSSASMSDGVQQLGYPSSGTPGLNPAGNQIAPVSISTPSPQTPQIVAPTPGI